VRRRTHGLRIAAAAGLVPVMIGTAGCLGLKDGPEPDAALTRYTGEGFTVGYPKVWDRPAGGRRVVPGSLFEVTAASVGEPIGSFDILTHWGGEELLDSVVSDFMRVSRAQRGFQLIGQARIDVSGHTGYQVRKKYEGRLGKTPRRLHTVDWFAQLKNGTVVDVRIAFLSDHYDASTVASVGRSLSVG
jgi:hypothetical protein